MANTAGTMRWVLDLELGPLLIVRFGAGARRREAAASINACPV
jgi:hypothetical protein